jgi:hypothetical protein
MWTREGVARLLLLVLKGREIVMAMRSVEMVLFVVTTIANNLVPFSIVRMTAALRQIWNNQLKPSSSGGPGSHGQSQLQERRQEQDHKYL